MGKNIPGIYNYCDRWCERCNFSSRCAVYESEQGDTEEEKDINNVAFWHKIASNFENAIKMAQQIAEEHGIDIENIPEEEEERYRAKELEIKSILKADPLILLCEQYVQHARSILGNESLWKAKADELLAQDQMGTSTPEELKEELDRIRECREVIQWYVFLLQLKFQRAISGALEDLEDSNEIQTDFNGSAKIALIAVQRSQYAWTQLFELIPNEDCILPALSLLSKIEKLGMERFPKAMEFVRTGFDEVEVGT